VTTVAGAAGASGGLDGVGSAARFNRPFGLVLLGAQLYVADSGNHAVRRLDPVSGTVVTVAGVLGTQGYQDSAEACGTTLLREPVGIAARAKGTGVLYVTDRGNDVIRAFTLK
jgi:hypothetical protein